MWVRTSCILFNESQKTFFLFSSFVFFFLFAFSPFLTWTFLFSLFFCLYIRFVLSLKINICTVCVYKLCTSMYRYQPQLGLETWSLRKVVVKWNHNYVYDLTSALLCFIDVKIANERIAHKAIFYHCHNHKWWLKEAITR